MCAEFGALSQQVTIIAIRHPTNSAETLVSMPSVVSRQQANCMLHVLCV